MKSRGRPLSVMAHLKKSIVEVKAEENCLSHALIIAIAKVHKDSNYDAFCKGRKIRQVVQTLSRRPGSICLTVQRSSKSSYSRSTFGCIR